MTFLELKPLTAEQLPAVVELDQLCFGGIWTLEGYRRELLSPSSDLLVLNLTLASKDVESPLGDAKGVALGEQLEKHCGPDKASSDRKPWASAQCWDLELGDTGAPPKSSLIGKFNNPKSEMQNPKSLVGLGCSWAILEEAHITLLAVHPDYRREGLGLLLLIALLRLAQRRGLERSTLEVRASNHAALSLYQKFGFQEAGRRRRYYKDTGEDALILWRGGLQKPEFAKTLEDWHKSVGDRLATKGWQLVKVGQSQRFAANG